MPSEYINIGFPFRDSNEGFFIYLNSTDKEAIKSNLLHLILTKKGSRLYLPKFGTNLLQYIFEPNDSLTEENIISEVKETIREFIPNLLVNNVFIDKDTDDEYTANVKIEYTITDGVFKSKDFVIINI